MAAHISDSEDRLAVMRPLPGMAVGSALSVRALEVAPYLSHANAVAGDLR